MYKKLLLIWGRQFLKPPRAADLLAMPLSTEKYDWANSQIYAELVRDVNLYT